MNTPQADQSGAQPSSWETVAAILPAPEFDFKKLVHSAATKHGRLNWLSDGRSDDETTLNDLSPLSSPPLSQPSSPAKPPPPLPPTAAPPLEANPGSSGEPSSAPNRAPGQGRKKRSHDNRKRKRQAAKEQCGPDGYEPRRSTSEKHLSRVEEVETPFSGTDIPIAKTGYVGIRRDQKLRVYGLKELVGPTSHFKLELLEWDGRTPVAILDKAGRIVAVLVGRPSNDPSWDEIHADAAAELERTRSLCKLSPSQKRHRRGRFPALATGISHGGGQTKPGNLSHQNPENDAVLRGLASHPAFNRLAGFASSAFATWAPRLYGYYSDHLSRLLHYDSRTHRPFKNSVWAAATFNFGPATACFPHTDAANLPFGWCGITALGNFDPKQGGHLVLWEAERVVEFPPGSTVLIPSAAIAHSNTPVRAGERRYSFTQYTAGGLFRWADHGFQTEKRHQASLSQESRAAEVIEQANQLEMGLGLFSTIPELRKTYTVATNINPSAHNV